MHLHVAGMSLKYIHIEKDVNNQGAKVANLFFDIFYPFMSYLQSAIANYSTAHM